MTHEDPIVIEKLTKTYGKFVAVDDLTFSVKKNSFTGMLGPNGAGKSTTLKILSNLTRATSGSVYLDGYDVELHPKNALKNVGTVVETPEFYTYLTPRETFRYIGKILGMSNESIATETDEILEKIKMSEWADKKLGTFSKGMRQRVALGQSLINSPSIIILDEPTSGLDPRGMAEIREILKELRKKESLTILMSSHMLHEVNDLCDRVAMVSRGKLIVNDDLSNVIGTKGTRKIEIKLIDEPNADILEKIKNLSNVTDVEYAGKNDVEIILKGGLGEQAQLLSEIGALNIYVYSFSSSENSLETSYLDLVKESI
ncbi:ABC transporter ATP-binding protein [Candidatus Methanomassiliicoccus intestinalis]|mgnify:FL=1|uniref:ABC transporter, ATP-binding protein n=2 Tax=Candidatus Methanomassiliicoccus intestinalis TaxID=1406512 RepID=R9T6H9_METII|nr:ABC transporter ATP-binding protein [Candidatus Methanomassiliicoccus intestinalis]AGN26174.1 ABC transporter, ATP-binding protein [Candidatus Methanomassiliicoccus intestinalis Issoire-Mx1]TQS84746.1 MAG: multidrug ABC transporter ATP-binding protein [Candidatus Methanomassiliicoccus intestinalis]